MNKILRSFLSIVMCMMLLFSVSVIAFGAGLTGSGTENDPYLIASASDLYALSEMIADGDDFSGKFVSLQKNITVSDAFVPLGTKETPFKGIFLGNGNSLSGFDVDRDYAGVFAFTDGAVISSLTVAGVFRATDYAGSVVAFAVDTVIENCTCAASVYADSFIGGIVGYIESGKVSGCKANTRISIGGYVDCCGGIAGFSGAVIEECTNNAFVYGEKNVGGIAGSASGDIVLCTNAARVESSDANLGGIVGLTEGAVKYSKNTGMVISSGTGVGKAGGIAGVGYGAEIAECINAGALNVSGNYAGGIAGYLTNSVVINSVSAANVSTSADYAGGIFGYALSSDISKCIAVSGVTADSAKGGIGALSVGTVADCYYNGSKTDKALATGTATATTAITDADIMNKSVYSKLDFENVWAINSVHASYPLLRNIPYHNITVTSSSEPTCTEDGVVSATCSVCQENIVTVTPAFGHSFTVTSSKEATCLTDGYEDVYCGVCGHAETTDFPAKGHIDANADGRCDTCGVNMKTADAAEKSFFQKIIDFFSMIIEWFRSLFK